MTPAQTPLTHGVHEALDLGAPVGPLLIELFDYWDAKRAGRLMPSRADIDPVELRSLVHNVMIYDVVEPGRAYRIRLVGQAIVDFVGVNTTGRLASEGMTPDAAKQMLDILNSLVTNRTPRFRCGRAHWHRDKSYRYFEACFLPLSPDDRTVDKILVGISFDTSDPPVDDPAKP